MKPSFFSPREMAIFLKDRGIHLTKRYGQNFLIDRHKAESIIKHMSIMSGDVVLEIGPGIGTMTHLLAEQAGKVYAVEIDKGLAVIAAEVMDGLNAEIIHCDFLKFDFGKIVEPRYKVYSSLPYNAATQIILKLAEEGSRVVSMTVMLPDEIVKRMSAKPDTGMYGVFSIFMNSFFEVADPCMKAEKRLFFPIPQVDSRIIDIIPRVRDARLIGEERKFLSFVSAVFQNRRKFFKTSLANALKEGVSDIIFEEYGLTGKERPENVPSEAYRSIYIRAFLKARP